MARLTRAERREIWQQRLDRYQQSNQTVTGFCKTEGISVPSFYQWNRRLIAEQHRDEAPRREMASSGSGAARGERASTPFAELVVMGPQPTAHAQLPNGVAIFLGQDVSIASAIVDRLAAYQPATEVTKSSPASRRSC